MLIRELKQDCSSFVAQFEGIGFKGRRGDEKSLDTVVQSDLIRDQRAERFLVFANHVHGCSSFLQQDTQTSLLEWG